LPCSSEAFLVNLFPCHSERIFINHSVTPPVNFGTAVSGSCVSSSALLGFLNVRFDAMAYARISSRHELTNLNKLLGLFST
jgi:hypothetical protein